MIQAVFFDIGGTVHTQELPRRVTAIISADCGASFI